MAVQTLLAIAVFTSLLVLLALLVQAARHWLLPDEPATIRINGSREVDVPRGTLLTEALERAGASLPAACGGGGTCGLCRVRVLAGGGVPSPVERNLLSRAEQASGVRLACQVRSRGGIEVRVPPEAFGVKTRTCRVRSARGLTPFIREIVLALPPGERLEFRAGAFVSITAPPYRLRLGDLPAAAEFPAAWDAPGLRDLVGETDQPVQRAYSLANHPGEPDVVMLDVRLALPPPGRPGVPPGVVSTWLFSLQEGDEVAVEGPFGHFFVEEGDSELVFIGGGVGMAPLRAQILDQLECRRTSRRISYWYGARRRADLFYAEDFERLAREHENFSWHVALSEPAEGDDWDGPTGFIHEVVLERHLAGHPAPEDCRYYLCGPPMMIRATLDMLDALGVEPENVFHDDFGS